MGVARVLPAHKHGLTRPPDVVTATKKEEKKGTLVVELTQLEVYFTASSPTDANPT